ncbi:hypothetical protein [Acidithiobacillus caldus]|uniref:hypothetical protein n=1 Tax=Acidithiobacillus caldus TaxID=33059 RepID=UPI0007DA054F|nr:hypothetical protein [Acidithiobacillus caldus]QER45662.1 hypothetical protein F0726_02610 [Acidithiobacillus caldus]
MPVPVSLKSATVEPEALETLETEAAEEEAEVITGEGAVLWATMTYPEAEVAVVRTTSSRLPAMFPSFAGKADSPVR